MVFTGDLTLRRYVSLRGGWNGAPPVRGYGRSATKQVEGGLTPRCVTAGRALNRTVA
jgi:hypothetical protein